MAERSDLDGGVEFVCATEEEWDQIVEDAAQFWMGMSRAEFERQIESGELDVNGPDHCRIMHVLMLLPDD